MYIYIHICIDLHMLSTPPPPPPPWGPEFKEHCQIRNLNCPYSKLSATWGEGG